MMNNLITLTLSREEAEVIRELLDHEHGRLEEVFGLARRRTLGEQHFRRLVSALRDRLTFKLSPESQL